MFGWSSGASLCLYAAAAGLELTRFALFEIPLSPKPVEGNDEASRLRELILADDRGGAVRRGATPLFADAAAALVAAMPAARSRRGQGRESRLGRRGDDRRLGAVPPAAGPATAAPYPHQKVAAMTP